MAVLLLERDGELATARELLAAAGGGAGRVLLVEGPAGEQWLTVMRVDFTQSKVSPQELSKIRTMMKQMIREQAKRKRS